MNETMTKAEVMLIDDVMMELETNSRGMIKILIYNQYFLLDISGVDHLSLSAYSPQLQMVTLTIINVLTLFPFHHKTSSLNSVQS